MRFHCIQPEASQSQGKKKALASHANTSNQIKLQHVFQEH